jgi:hypothetical protein
MTLDTIARYQSGGFSSRVDAGQGFVRQQRQPGVIQSYASLSSVSVDAFFGLASRVSK